MKALAIIIFSVLLGVPVLTFSAQNVMANCPANSGCVEGVPNPDTGHKKHNSVDHPSTDASAKQNEKSRKQIHESPQCYYDGFCGPNDNPQQPKTHHSGSHHNNIDTAATVDCSLPVNIKFDPRCPVPITYCNNTQTTGPFTTFFNNIVGCPVNVLFESTSSVQLQYLDDAPAQVYITQAETTYHWYEISHQDDGILTTLVLAPLQ